MPTMNIDLDATYVDIGVADSVNVHLSTTGEAYVELVFSPTPPANSFNGVLLNKDTPLNATLTTGDKCYAKSFGGSATTLVVVT